MKVRTQLQLIAKYANFISDESLQTLLRNLAHAQETKTVTIEFGFRQDEAVKYLKERSLRDISMSTEPRIVRKVAVDVELDSWIDGLLSACNDNLTIHTLRDLRCKIMETYTNFARHMLE